MAPKTQHAQSPARGSVKPKAKAAVQATTSTPKPKAKAAVQATTSSPKREDSHVINCFQLCDVDGDGKITRRDLEHVLRNLLPLAGTDYDFDRFFGAADLDKYIDYKDFCGWVFGEEAGKKFLHDVNTGLCNPFQLPVKALSGEPICEIPNVTLLWTTADLLRAFTREQGPSPDGFYYALICGGEMMDGKRELMKYNVQNSDICVVTTEIPADLVVTSMPRSIDEARGLIREVDKNDLWEVRCIRSPSYQSEGQCLMTVVQCLALLRPLGREKPDKMKWGQANWDHAKSYLLDATLLPALLEYQPDRTDAKAIAKIKQLLGKGDMCDIAGMPTRMTYVSKLAYVVLEFVLAIVEWWDAWVACHPLGGPAG